MGGGDAASRSFVHLPQSSEYPRAESLLLLRRGHAVVVGINADGSFITRNIEDLKEGDLVLSRDEFEATGRVEFKPIVATSEKTSDHLRIVTLIDDAGNIQTIRTTDEHPFYAPGIGWTSAKDLEGGRQLATADSTKTLTVLSSIREEQGTGVKVYNFTVADNHTYFVTDAPTRGPPAAVWVHNQCAKPGIYEFVSSTGLKYVGQSVDIALRIKEHIRNGLLLEKDIHTIREFIVEGGKMAREVAEQRRMIELGGIRLTNGVKNLENIKNPIGRARGSLLTVAERAFLGYV